MCFLILSGLHSFCKKIKSGLRAVLNCFCVARRCFETNSMISDQLNKLQLFLLAGVSHRRSENSDPAEQTSMTVTKIRKHFSLKIGLVCYLHKGPRELLAVMTRLARILIRLYRSKSRAMCWFYLCGFYATSGLV